MNAIWCDYCDRFFGGYRAFSDAHRGATCAEPDELTRRGLVLSRHGVWRQVAPRPYQSRMRLQPAIPSDGTARNGSGAHK